MSFKSKKKSSFTAWLWCASGLMLCSLLCAGMVVLVPTTSACLLWLDWQPQQAFTQPWRCLSAVFLHYSGAHLAGNLLACALVAGYGWAAQVPTRVTLAWCLAWPLMHLSLLSQPTLKHYAGLSGLMHAGVACVNVYLILGDTPRSQKIIGAIMQVMLWMKVLSETPWVAAVQYSADWRIPIAPIGHLMGLAVGTLCAVGVEYTRADPAPRLAKIHGSRLQSAQ
jgi:membrane associated rhomboid family serine protease